MKWTYRYLLIRILGVSRAVLVRLLRCAHVILHIPIVPTLAPHHIVLGDATGTLTDPTSGIGVVSMVNIIMIVILRHRVGIGWGNLILGWNTIPRIVPSMLLIRIIDFKGLLWIRHTASFK